MIEPNFHLNNVKQFYISLMTQKALEDLTESTQ